MLVKSDNFSFEGWTRGDTPEKDELVIDFKKRVVHAMEDIIKDGETILVVAHGGVFWALPEMMNSSNTQTDNCNPFFFAANA